jgi:Polyketide synthase dehydratase N-terminal domain
VLEPGAARSAKKREAPKTNGGKTKKTAAKAKGKTADKGSIDKGGIYRVYFHGPAYQVLSRVALLADGSVEGTMAADLPADVSQPGRSWIHAPRLVELCFQTAGVYEIGLTSQMGLPAAIGKVTVYETPAASQPLVAEVRPRRTDGGLVYDAAVRDDAGRVYVELSGYATSAIPGSLPEGDLGPFKPVGQGVD